MEYREAVHSPPKRHRLATTTHASVDAAVKAAGDAAAQAVIDAAAAAPTAAEAAAAAEEANVAVAEAAHEVVAHAAPAAQVASGGNAPGHEDGEASEVSNRNKSICFLELTTLWSCTRLHAQLLEMHMMLACTARLIVP